MNNPPFRSDIKFSEHRKNNFYQAAFLDRLAALLIDQFVIVLICGLLLQIFISLGLSKLPISLILLATPFVYMIFTQVKWGQSLGKKMLAIQVINYHSGGLASFKNLFIREVFGRFLSALFFCIGYIWPLFSKSGFAWHDILTGTQVVTLKSTRPSFLLVVGGGLSTIFCLIGIAAYLLLYTSAPLNLISNEVRRQYPIDINQLGGSLIKGVTIGSISGEYQGGDFQISDAKIIFDFYNYSETHDLVLKEFSFSSARLHSKSCFVKQDFQKNKFSQFINDPKTSLRGPKGAQSFDNRKVNSLWIGLVDFNNINVVDDCQKTPFNIQRIYLSDVDILNNVFKINRTYVDSSYFTINLPQIEISKGAASLEQYGSLSLKPALHHMIKKSIPIQFIFKLQHSNQFEAKLFAFQNKLVLSRTFNGTLNLYSREFTPDEYFTTNLPARKITFQSSAQSSNLFNIMHPKGNGSFYFENKKLILRGSEAFLEEDPRLKFNFNAFSLAHSIAQPKVFLTYENPQQPISKEEVIHRLLFQNRYDESDLNQIDQIHKYSSYLKATKNLTPNIELSQLKKGQQMSPFARLPRKLPERRPSSKYSPHKANKGL